MLPDDLFEKKKSKFWSTLYYFESVTFIILFIFCFLLPKNSPIFGEVVVTEVVIGVSIIFYILGLFFRKLSDIMNTDAAIVVVYLYYFGVILKYTGAAFAISALFFAPWEGIFMFFWNKLF